MLGLRARADSATDEFGLYLTQPTVRSSRIFTTIATYYTRQTEDYQTTPTEKLGVSIQQDLLESIVREILSLPFVTANAPKALASDAEELTARCERETMSTCSLL